MSKTNLSTTFYRSRLIERNRSIFVWEFGQFEAFTRFYSVVKNSSRKHAEARIDFYVCQVGSSDELLLDSVKIDSYNEPLLSFDHPRRVIKTGQTLIGISS